MRNSISVDLRLAVAPTPPDLGDVSHKPFLVHLVGDSFLAGNLLIAFRPGPGDELDRLVHRSDDLVAWRLWDSVRRLFIRYLA